MQGAQGPLLPGRGSPFPESGSCPRNLPGAEGEGASPAEMAVGGSEQQPGAWGLCDRARTVWLHRST